MCVKVYHNDVYVPVQAIRVPKKMSTSKHSVFSSDGTVRKFLAKLSRRPGFDSLVEVASKDKEKII